MASQPSLRDLAATARHEQPPMSLLPDLSPEERAELRRIKQENREREQRFAAALTEMETKQREALEVLTRLKQELRFPLESVRVDDDAR